MTVFPTRKRGEVFEAGTGIHTREYQAFRILQLAFIVAPIVAGIDKFANAMVSWDQYLLPWVPQMLNMTPRHFMMMVGVIEIVAGIGVALKPKIFGYVVSAWLAGIIVNLLLKGMYFDIALRDLGLCLAAFCLARLSHDYDIGPIGGLMTREKPKHMPRQS